MFKRFTTAVFFIPLHRKWRVRAKFLKICMLSWKLLIEIESNDGPTVKKLLDEIFNVFNSIRK